MRASDKASFLHDADASRDERVMEMMVEHGYWGYGVYWALVERMREANSHRLDVRLISGLARLLGEPVDKIESFINTCERVGLFCREEESFIFSHSLRRRMDAFAEKRTRRAEAGRKGGFSKALAMPSNARAMPEQCASNATAMPSLLNPNTNTTPIDPSTSLVGTDLGTNPVPDPSKPTLRAVRTRKIELPPLPKHLDTDTGRHALERWFVYKCERRESYKPSSVTAFITKISAWTDAQLAAAVTHCIAEGYQGLFIPKPNNGGRPAKLSNLDKAKELMRQAIEAGNE